MDEADDDSAQRSRERLARRSRERPAPVPLSITESDLNELEVFVTEAPMPPPPSDTRRLLESLPVVLDRTQRWTVVFGGILGCLIAGGVAFLFILKLGLYTSMNTSSAIEVGLIASVITAILTYVGAALLRLERRPIDDWMERLEDSLR